MPPVRGIAWAGRSKEPSEVPSRAPPGGNAASNGPAAGRVVSKDWWRGRHRSASDWRVPPGDRRATEPFRPREGGQSATEVGKRRVHADAVLCAVCRLSSVAGAV